MQNGLKIKWTEEAINNLEDILSYLKIRWTTREINRFFIKISFIIV
jgi:plasmid stabilization system protein ParE